MAVVQYVITARMPINYPPSAFVVEQCCIHSMFRSMILKNIFIDDFVILNGCSVPCPSVASGRSLSQISNSETGPPSPVFVFRPYHHVRTLLIVVMHQQTTVTSTMTSSNTSVKESLLKRLAVLLNVGDEDNDYVTDVLDQLIEIGEDVDDVASYLTSFLGGDDDGDVDNHLAQFANDVRRFKLGEEIVIETVGSSPPKSDADVLQQPPQEKDRTHQRQLQQQRKEEEELKKQKPVRQQISDKPVSAAAPVKKVTQSSETNEKQKKDRVLQSNKGGSSKQTNKAYSSTTKKDTSKQQISKSKSLTTKQKQLPLTPKELKKGKAKRICGCY
eukprot:scaffold6485_cov116-Skeletonema_dohrnii-CCMP3373.AAC.1